MSDYMLSGSAWTKSYVRCLPLVFLLCLAGCGGGTSTSSIVTPPPPPGPPSINSLSAKTGLVGELVTVSGSNFGSSQGSSTVTFNGTSASSIASWSGATVVAKVPSGATTGKVVVTVGGAASNGVNFTVATTLPSGSLTPSNFGFQCGTQQNACPNEAWPSSIAQPGLLRLWDSGTNWNDIESTTPGAYDFSTLDGWLDTIYAQNQSNAWATPIDVILTFGFVSCVEASNTNGQTPKGCIYPPSDFTNSLAGSQSFNNFVTALVQRCNPNNRCVKDLIKNYEMWNEPNNQFFWHDTTTTVGELEIFRMVYPAVAIIRQNVPGAVIMTMASTADAGYTQQWLQYENANPPVAGGTLSDVVVWHQYLNRNQTEVAPEDSSNLSTFAGIINAKNTAGNGWDKKPWRITETGFQAFTSPYGCDTTIFSTTDCVGQMVRWQLFVLSNGAQGQDWYSWNVNIGSQPQYNEAWNLMMQYLVGGSFSAACSQGSDGVTWTCPFTEFDGTTALWVWTTSNGGSNFTVPSQFSGYRDLTGAAQPVNSGQPISIGVMPIMLEQ